MLGSTGFSSSAGKEHCAEVLGRTSAPAAAENAAQTKDGLELPRLPRASVKVLRSVKGGAGVGDGAGPSAVTAAAARCLGPTAHAIREDEEMGGM